MRQITKGHLKSAEEERASLEEQLRDLRNELSALRKESRLGSVILKHEIVLKAAQFAGSETPNSFK